MRRLLAEVAFVATRVGYWVRPYDMLADRRRWWWQRRQRCPVIILPEPARTQLAQHLATLGGVTSAQLLEQMTRAAQAVRAAAQDGRPAGQDRHHGDNQP